MKKLEYVGLKRDGERAFKEHTGIEWMPGDVHHVKPEHAEHMLKHSDVWREVPSEPAALASAPSATVTTDLPEWVKQGIELGASDEPLEAIAQAGGPETEQGAELWKEATGAACEPEDEKETKATQSAKKTPAKKTPKKG